MKFDSAFAAESGHAADMRPGRSKARRFEMRQLGIEREPQMRTLVVRQPN